MDTNADKEKMQCLIAAIRDLKVTSAAAGIPITITTNKFDKGTGRVSIEVPKAIFDKVK